MEILDSFKLIGPNRRCEQTAVELWLKLTPDEGALMQASAGDLWRRVLARLSQLGVPPDRAYPPEAPPADSGALQYATLLGHIALAVQRLAGHRIDFIASYPASDSNVACVAVEYEHGDAGLEAIRLAICLLEELMPGIRLADPSTERDEGFSKALQSYLETAPEQLLPLQTQDIIEAAQRMDVPWVKLDRDPYEGLSGDFRIRPNGMLKLGQARRQRVIDGTLPLDGGDLLAGMAHDRAQIRHVLESLGAPLVSALTCSSTRQAVRAAQDIGLPVLIKPRRVNRARHFGSVAGPLTDLGAVADAARSALKSCPGLMVESYTPGRTYRAVLANTDLLAVLELRGGMAVADVTGGVHADTHAWLSEISRRLDAPLLTVTWVSTDFARPLMQAGRVVSMNVAPQLDVFLPDDAPVATRKIRRRAAEGLVRHLFPAGRTGRIPLIAVTGTNGKSTVCAMVARIMQRCGYCVGRAGTTGLYLNDELLEAGDFAGGKGHHKVLESPRADLAVLETARGAVSGLGLMFDHCDVAVCTNVSADHLGERGIDTVEQMAELKLFIVRRARRAVVLNADDEHSATMLPKIGSPKAWLVSERLNPEQMRARFGAGVRFCFAESADDGEWISLQDSERSLRVMQVAEIPATLGGRARFNVSNALQAIAAAFQMGASIEDIRSGMADYTTHFDNSPGRLNFYDGLPFKVLFDFAHNEAGHRALRSIVDTMQSDGRKILLLMRRGNTPDRQLFELASIVAGGYDLFICRDHPKLMGRQPGEVTALLKEGLLRNGIPPEAVIEAPGDEALDTALRTARPGDILVVTTATEYLYQDWRKITRYTVGHS